MRHLPLLAFAAALALAPAAFAQAPAPPPPADQPPADDQPLPPIAEDQAQADAMTARLQALDTRIGADEARMTTLRDAELARENARILAIKPALPFHGGGFFSGWL